MVHSLFMVGAAGLLAGGLIAGPPGNGERAGDMHVVAADCNAAARRVVAETGGQLLSVTSSSEGGRITCHITVLVHGGHDTRPRKMTVAVPQ